MFWIFCIAATGIGGVLSIIKMGMQHHEKIMAHDEEMNRIKNGYILADPSSYKDVTESPKRISDESAAPYRQYEN